MRKYLIAGVLVWVPIIITVWVVYFLLEIIDTLFAWIPVGYQPNNIFGTYIPGLNLLVLVLILFLTGILVANFIGRRLIMIWDGFFAKIPFVRSIYSSVKQSLHMLLSSGNAFDEVVMIEYPRKGSWSLGFVTNRTFSFSMADMHDGLIAVFVPTTPNPTSGYILLLPPEDIHSISLSVDEGLKFIVSLGMVVPEVAVKK